MTERFITPGPLPTPREREILTILIEEAAEVQQRATKALRFGLTEIQPSKTRTNRVRLSAEMGDLSCIAEMAFAEKVMDRSVAEQAHTQKKLKLAKYMQTQPDVY